MEHIGILFKKMSHVVNHDCTPLIISFASKKYSTLEKLRHINKDFRDSISHNPQKIWNRFFTQDCFETAAKIGSMNFISHNYDNNWETLYSFPALCISLLNGHIDFFREICKIYKTKDEIILFVACRYGHFEIIKEIVERKNFDINICFEPDEDEVFSEKLSIYDVNRKFTISRESSDYFMDDVFHFAGARPIHAACMFGDTEIVKYLISQGAKIFETEWRISILIACMAEKENFELYNYLFSIGVRDKSSGCHIGAPFLSTQSDVYHRALHDFDFFNYNCEKYPEEFEKNRIHANELFEMIDDPNIIMKYGDPYFIEMYDLNEEFEEYLSQKTEERIRRKLRK